MACNPHPGYELRCGLEHCATSVVEPAEVTLLLWPRLVRELFGLIPSFSPIFFQPEAWALMARWNVLGDVPKPQSIVGGVVGGVIGSAAGEAVQQGASMIPRSAALVNDVLEPG